MHGNDITVLFFKQVRLLIGVLQNLASEDWRDRGKQGDDFVTPLLTAAVLPLSLYLLDLPSCGIPATS